MITSFREVPTWQGKWLWIQSKMGWLDGKMKIVRTPLHGRAWKIPVIDGLGKHLAVGTATEPWMLEALKSIHQQNPIGLFVDIGMNMGQTMLKLKSINTQIPYVGIEPNPMCVSYVDFLIRFNDITHTQIICTAMGDHPSMATLHFKGREDTRASTRHFSNTPKDLIFQRKVPVVRLDDFTFETRPGTTTIVKIDVEGHELEVLQGAVHFIKKYAPVLLFECLPHLGDDEMRSRNHQLMDLVRSNGYQIWLLKRDGQKSSVDKDFENPDDYTQVDFIAVPAHSKSTME